MEKKRKKERGIIGDLPSLSLQKPKPIIIVVGAGKSGLPMGGAKETIEALEREGRRVILLDTDTMDVEKMQEVIKDSGLTPDEFEDIVVGTGRNEDMLKTEIIKEVYKITRREIPEPLFFQAPETRSDKRAKEKGFKRKGRKTYCKLEGKGKGKWHRRNIF